MLCAPSTCELLAGKHLAAAGLWSQPIWKGHCAFRQTPRSSYGHTGQSASKLGGSLCWSAWSLHMHN